jgi:hypothetical protein
MAGSDKGNYTRRAEDSLTSYRVLTLPGIPWNIGLENPVSLEGKTLNNSTAALDSRKYYANPLMENALRDTE